MKFYKNQLFHIYNQGNNRQKIFFSDENYVFFIWKMRAYLLPFGDFIAWTLMPNHYHWLFYVRKIEIPRNELNIHVDQIENKRRKIKYGHKAQSKINRGTSKNSITLNDAIGILERTYARAINKQEDRTGSLFRNEAKAKDGWINEFITVTKSNGNPDFRFLPGYDYGFQCLNYIHQNPVEANLAKKPTDYLYSSAMDYAGLRNGSLCNLELGKELLNFI